MSKDKRQIVKSMEEPDEEMEPVTERIDVRIGDDMAVMAEGVEEPIVLQPGAKVTIGGHEVSNNTAHPVTVMAGPKRGEPLIVLDRPTCGLEVPVEPSAYPLLARALPFLLSYSRHGRGSRCPVCGQIIGHQGWCKLAALIAEIEKVTK